MNNRMRFHNNGSFRDTIHRNLQRIEYLEANLQQRESIAASLELVNYYIQLGDAYSDLLGLLMSPTRNTMKWDAEPTQSLVPFSSSTTTSPVPMQNTLPMQNTVAIANSYYELASALVNQETYPENRREFDKKRIEDAAKNARQKEATARININEAAKATDIIIKTNKKPYDGFWIQPIAFRLPLALLIFLIPIIIVSFYWRIPISVTLHIAPYDCESGSITINSSTTLMPLITNAVSAYHTLCSDSTIMVHTANLSYGNDNNLNQLLAENSPINIVTTDTFADAALSQLQEYPVAIAVYAIVVNKDVNHLQEPDLSSNQITAIYSGAITNWSAINPHDPNWNSEDITLISRPSTSASRAIFERYVLDGPETVSGPPHLFSDTDGTIADSVCNNSGAIGYIPLSYYYSYNQHHNDCLHLVSIDRHDPQSEPLIQNNIYKFWSLEHMYTNNSATGLTQSFINFMYSNTMKSYFDQYNTYGYLDISDVSASILSTH